MKKIELVTNNMIEKIIAGIENASTIYILTAFVMKSGVDLLKPHLEKAAARGADIKVCTGDYLYITQPAGLKELISIHNELEVRMWRSNGISFHPKAYIFLPRGQVDWLMVYYHRTGSYGSFLFFLPIYHSTIVVTKLGEMGKRYEFFSGRR